MEERGRREGADAEERGRREEGCGSVSLMVWLDQDSLVGVWGEEGGRGRGVLVVGAQTVAAGRKTMSCSLVALEDQCVHTYAHVWNSFVMLSGKSSIA